LALLENLIRDPNQSVRVEAVEALIELKVKSCCNSVEATRSMYSHDDHSWLDRKLRQLQDNDTNDQQTAQKQAIEKLQSRIKSLEDKLTLQEALAKAK
jgi:aminopeptidase N